MNTNAGRAEALLAWYDENKRELPWRSEPTPYHVWLSEIMLQQTRVEAVREYYRRFLGVLPSIEALAEADEDVYLKLWEGLGYYSRVRNLHKAAVQIMTEHSGRMPENSKELQKLAGIGPYTSAAIASICFGERIPALDGNLLRVFARMTGYDGSIKTDAAKKAAREYYLEIFPETDCRDENMNQSDAVKMLDQKRRTGISPGAGCEEKSRVPADTAKRAEQEQQMVSFPGARCGDMNQALMDLGATVCLPNGQPLCGACPWAEHCVAHQTGRETELPVLPAKKTRAVEHLTVFLIYYDQKLALRKRPEEGLLAGLYEFPNAPGRLSRAEAMAYAASLGFGPVRLQRLQPAKHIFTHKEWHMTGWQVLADEWQPFTSGAPREHELFLATAEELEKTYSIPSAFSKYQKEIRRDYL